MTPVTLLYPQLSSDPTPHSVAGSRREAASVTSFPTIGKKTGERQEQVDSGVVNSVSPWQGYRICVRKHLGC